jgi:NADH-quinone oxidoreductase subunit F
MNLSVDVNSLRKIGFVGRLCNIEVFDERNCMVSLAKLSLNSAMEGLCGKCIPCREGSKRMLEILESITLGTAIKEELDVLQELICTVADTSLCRLGKISVNPVASTLKYFRNEYMTHIIQKKCPVNICKMEGKSRKNGALRSMTIFIRIRLVLPEKRKTGC